MNRSITTTTLLSCLFLASLSITSVAATTSTQLEASPQPNRNLRSSRRRSLKATDSCGLQLSVQYDAPKAEATLCDGRPTTLQLKYDASRCEASVNSQIGTEEKLFLCQDFQEEAVKDWKSSYIVVTSKNGDMVYHEGIVDVGSFYTLESGEDEPLDPDVLVSIYENSDKEELVQLALYHTSCSGDSLWLHDRFGSSTIAGWTNEEQGTVTSMVNQEFQVEVTGPNASAMTFTGLYISSSHAPHLFELNDRFLGATIAPGARLQVTASVPVDTTESSYTMAIAVDSDNKDAEECSVMEIVEFTIGS